MKHYIFGGILILFGIWGGAWGVNHFNEIQKGPFVFASVITQFLFIAGGLALIAREANKNV